MCLRSIFISAVILAASVAGAAGPKSASHQIILIENMQFSPVELTVHRGDTVEWINKDLVAHSATSVGKGFDSKLIAPEAKWTFHAKSKGTFKYKCSFHPTMAAILIVQ